MSSSLHDSEPLVSDTAFDEESVPTVLGAAHTLPVEVARSEAKRKTAEADRDLEPVEAIDEDDGAGEGAEVVYVFDANTTVTPKVRKYVQRLYGRRKFIAALSKSEIRSSRSSTALGLIWNILDPLFQSAIYFFLFTVIRGGEGGRPIDFLPVLIGGVFLFTLSTTALSEGGRSVTTSQGLMLNSTFPRALLPIAAVYKGILKFLPTAFVFVGVYAVLGAGLQIGLLYLPVLFAIQTVLGLGLALLTSTVVVFFRDVQNALRYVQRILFFTTPIIYPASALPDAVHPWINLNPLYALFASYQAVMFGGTPNQSEMLQATGWAIGLFVLGGWMFMRYERAMAAKL